ncbi:MAG: HlyD family secretion protein [Lepagella sp.]
MKSYKIIFTMVLGMVMASCGSKEAEYDASGIFECTEVIVSAKATGEIIDFNIEEGMDVTADSLLGMIDSRQLQERRRALGSNRQATDSRMLDRERQVASLRQQISNLEKEKARFTSLVAAKAATQKQVDDIDYQIGVLNRQLQATIEQIESNNATLRDQKEGIDAEIAQVDIKISDSEIASPISGRILTKYAEPGEYATAGKPLFKVADITRIRLRAYITADQLTRIKLGQKVKVYADQGKADRKAYEGKISWISDKAEFTPKTIQTRDERSNLVYAIKIDVNNDGLIKRGMYGDVKF